MSDFNARTISRRVGDNEDTVAFFFRAIRAAQATANHNDRAVIWWMHGDTSSLHGSSWMAILSAVLSTVDKPLVYLPTLDIDSAGAQLVEHWFSFCEVNGNDLEQIMAIYNVDSADTRVCAMILKRPDVHVWRRMEPHSASVAMEQDCRGVLFMIMQRDNDAFEIIGDGDLIEKFDHMFRG